MQEQEIIDYNDIRVIIEKSHLVQPPVALIPEKLSVQMTSSSGATGSNGLSSSSQSAASTAAVAGAASSGTSNQLQLQTSSLSAAITSATNIAAKIAESGVSNSVVPHTVFVVEIISKKTSKVIHVVEKRYKDFLSLHRSIRAKFPEVDGLQFPKKTTPFTTFKKSTVDERRAFFQGYINALLSLKPRPADVLIFLGLETTAPALSKGDASASSGNQRLIGTSLNDFELLCVLGKGAFGKVFLVRERHLDQLFAMKVLKKKEIIRRKQVEHTLTERDLMGSIHHPFIVELKFSFQTKHNLFMVSELCPGGELFFHLRRLRGFTEDLIRFYTAGEFRCAHTQYFCNIFFCSMFDLIFTDISYL